MGPEYSGQLSIARELMPRFLLGDELGHIKSLRYDPDRPTDAQDGRVSLKILTNTTCHAGVQCLAASSSDSEHSIAWLLYENELMH
jgi:hypothetical protein